MSEVAFAEAFKEFQAWDQRRAEKYLVGITKGLTYRARRARPVVKATCACGAEYANHGDSLCWKCRFGRWISKHPTLRCSCGGKLTTISYECIKCSQRRMRERVRSDPARHEAYKKKLRDYKMANRDRVNAYKRNYFASRTEEQRRKINEYQKRRRLELEERKAKTARPLRKCVNCPNNFDPRFGLECRQCVNKRKGPRLCVGGCGRTLPALKPRCWPCQKKKAAITRAKLKCKDCKERPPIVGKRCTGCHWKHRYWTDHTFRERQLASSRKSKLKAKTKTATATNETRAAAIATPRRTPSARPLAHAHL